MNQISPQLGPPLMLIFVCMTNILLITSLISILSDSFSKVISHAKEEYLFVYSVYVLEASTSNRLTHFYPPLNLIPLILIRPLRLFMSSTTLRRTRIGLLKATHAPIVLAINLFEGVYEQIQDPSSFPNTPILTESNTPHHGGIGVDVSENEIRHAESNGNRNENGSDLKGSKPTYKTKAKKKFLASRTRTNQSLHYLDGPSEERHGDTSPLVARWNVGERDVGVGIQKGDGKGKKIDWEDSGLGGEDDGEKEDDDARDDVKENGGTRREEATQREIMLEKKIDDLARKMEELMGLFLADRGMGGGEDEV